MINTLWNVFSKTVGFLLSLLCFTNDAALIALFVSFVKLEVYLEPMRWVFYAMLKVISLFADHPTTFNSYNGFNNTKKIS